MRILHWTESFWPAIGGAEIQVQNLIRRQQQQGWETAVVANRAATSLPSEEQLGTTPIRRCDGTQALLAGNLAGVRRIVDRLAEFKRQFRPDVVHLHIFGPFSWFHLLTIKAQPAATIATLHASAEYLLPRTAHQLIARVLAETDWVIGVSETQLASYRVRFAALTPKSSVIHNGLPLPDDSPKPLPGNRGTLLCLGRIVAGKGFDLALESFARIAPAWPNARLIIAGDGPAKTQLERRAADLGLSGRVDFRGWVQPSHVGTLINEASIVVVPSRYEEPFGLVAVEAAQMGRPVVAAHTGGLPEVVVHEETGLLVPPEDPAALARAIGSLLARPGWGQRLGTAARARALARFSIAACADAYEHLYLRHAHRQRCHSPL